jgi:hypothetical protein
MTGSFLFLALIAVVVGGCFRLASEPLPSCPRTVVRGKQRFDQPGVLAKKALALAQSMPCLLGTAPVGYWTVIGVTDDSHIFGLLVLGE